MADRNKHEPLSINLKPSSVKNNSVLTGQRVQTISRLDLPTSEQLVQLQQAFDIKKYRQELIRVGL